MSGRLPMPGAMPAELAERLSDANVHEVTKLEEADAVKSIIDDYLLVGDTYPRIRIFGKRCIDLGTFLHRELDADTIEAVLAGVAALDVAGSDLPLRLRRFVEEQATAWIRKHYADLVQERAEDMRDQ
jgi:hypothetical protein